MSFWSRSCSCATSWNNLNGKNYVQRIATNALRSHSNLTKMQPEQGDMFERLIRPPISEIPHFVKPPPPEPFPNLLSTFKSTIPTDSRVPRQPPLLDISLQVSVAPALYFRLLPRLYPKLPLPCPIFDDLYASSHTVSVANAPANRALLHHALYGILTYSPSQPPSIISNVLAANLHALSKILRRAPTFAISLESSPYFGVAGLEARIILSLNTSPTTSPPSYHLLGISAPDIHIPSLECLLREICPQFRNRLLGVTANLTPEQHNSTLGITASRAIAHFMRLATKGPFITPDMTLSPPPLTPVKLVALTKEDITNLVNQYRPRLEQSWGPETFDDIIKENEQLRHSQVPSKAGGEGMLEHSWAIVGDQYPNLRKFVAALATVYAYRPAIRTKVSITCKESTDPSFAAEFVLQARQFVQLRKALVA